MKKITTNFLRLLAIVIILSSCQKEFDYPTNRYADATIVDGDTVGRWGTFIVVDAVMYVENLETGEKKVYQHFSPTKRISSLRWEGSIYPIETIIKDSTTYTFYRPRGSYGNFVLNSDTSQHYNVYYKGMYSTIIEDPVYGMQQQMMGGSARPFSCQVWDSKEKTIAMQIQETADNIDGYNVRYWTQLKLKKIVEF